MLDSLSLRVRFFLFFALIAIAVPLLIGGAPWLAAQRLEGNPGPHLLLFGGAAAIGLILVVAWVWQLFDANVAVPILAIVRDLQTLMHANPKNIIDTQSSRYLGLLAPVVREVGEAFASARSDVGEEIARATRSFSEQRGQFEAILRELNEGVIVCNASHRVLLYNWRALQILDVTEEPGLRRLLFSILNQQPFILTMDRLATRYMEGRHREHPDHLTTTLVFARTDGSLRAAVEMLVDMPATDIEGRKAFQQVLTDETQRLSDELERFGAEDRQIVTSQWPMSDVHTGNLFNALTRRFRDDESILCDVVGEAIWLRCDSTTIVALLDHLIRRALIELEANTFLLSARAGPQWAYLEVVWESEDAVAEHFAIEIPPETRHTAIGDALATAGVLLKLIDLLEVHGIKTLREAIAASNKIIEIRRQQAKY